MPKSPTLEASKQDVRHVGFECHVCGTRMYANAQHAGKKMKCPDCGGLTVIPEPPAPKSKNMPAALEGEQYELWDPENQPLPSELIAQQPKYIAVVCDRCGTLMHAAELQAGQTIKCPDCNTQNVVRAPKRATKKSIVSAEIEIPGLDLDAAPAPRPGPLTPEARARIHAQEKAAAETNVARKTDKRGRPVMPPWPLVTGILPFLFSPGVPIRWFMFTIVSVGYDAIAMYGLSTIGNVGGGYLGQGMGAIAGICFMLIGLILCVVWLAGLSSTFFAIVTESSEGHDIIQAWPQPNMAEWFPELFYFLVAVAVSGTPGALVARFAVEGLPYGAASIALSIVVLLPVVILSQLEGGSVFSVFTPRILQSLLRCPFSWLLFYLETGLLVAICVGLSFFVPPIAVTPVLVLSVILYARLLGRLGWRLAETMEITV